MRNKTVLMIGGPADGRRQIVEPNVRYIRIADPHGPDREYTIHPLVGLSGMVHYVATMSLTDCPIKTLIQGYGHQHPSDPTVAENLVTLLGGKANGQHAIPPSPLVKFMTVNGQGYHVVTLDGKDRKKYLVGVTDAIISDPIKLLIDGYRKEAC